MAGAKVKPSGKYCMYLRRSRADLEEEARGAGETLARHHHMLMEMAQRMKIAIPAECVYREIVSGDTIAERPVVQALLRDVEKESWDGVVVADVDRLARGDTLDQGIIAQTFLYTHTLIITPYKIYDPNDPSDREFFEMKLFFARREYDQIKRRLQTGRVNSVKEGLYVASRAPYGYKRYKLPDRKGYTLVADAKEAAVVKMIFDWYVNGMDGAMIGATQIANELNRMGVKTKYGKSWIPDTIIRMLKNPIYVGSVRWYQHVQKVKLSNGARQKVRVLSDHAIVAQGLHESIVEEDLFLRAQRMRKENTLSSVRADRALANPFAGLLVCAQCGRTMTRQRGNARYPSYHLVKCPTSGCPTSGIGIALLEKAVLGELKNWRAHFADLDAASRAPRENPMDEIIRSCEKQIATVKTQISSLRDLLEQGVYTVEIYRARMVELSARLDEARAQHEELTKKRPVTVDEAIQAELPAISSVLDLYDFDAPAAEKNALLKTVISHIVYHKTQKTRHNTNPLSYLTLDIYPVFPQDES